VAESVPAEDAFRGTSERNKKRQWIEKRWLRPQVYLARLGVVIGVLMFWQFGTGSLELRQVLPFLDPFFISSPLLVGRALVGLATGSGGQPLVWPFVFLTLEATLIGAVIGIAAGVILGLLLSNDRRLRQVFAPFINALNSMPKIALIPVIIIIFGPSAKSTITVSVMTVFFTVFYNAYAGGRGVSDEMLQNARLLGASPVGTMFHIRFMYVFLWTFEALPNAISHGLLSVVTTEILSGSAGIGRLIVQALANLDANLTFAIVVLLSVIGVTMVGLADSLRGRTLHWWPGAK
jgi:NitT/TauT family transport system permease protein